MHYIKGKEVFKQGDKANHFYLIIHGQVELSRSVGINLYSIETKKKQLEYIRDENVEVKD